MKIESKRVPLTEYFRYISPKDLPLYPKSKIDSTLNEFVTDQLILFDAYKNKIDRQPGVKETIDAYKYNSLVEFYFKKHVIDSLITEETLIQRYRSYSDEYRSYHPYKKVRDDLYRLELSYKKMLIEDNIARLYGTIKYRSLLKVFPDRISSFTKIYNDSVRAAIENGSADLNPLLLIAKIPFDSNLAQTRRQSYNISWLLETIKLRQLSFPDGVVSPQMFTKILEDLIIEDLIYRQALSENLDKDKEFLIDLNRFKDEVVLKVYLNEKLKADGYSIEDSIKCYYEKHKDSLYLQPARMEVYAIFVDDSITGNRVLKRVLQNEDFTQLFKKFSTRKLSSDGYLGFITEKDYGNIGYIALRLKPNTSYNQLIPVGKSYAIIKTRKYLPPQPAPFEEVKQKVVMDYAQTRYLKLKTSLFKDISHKYRYKVYPEILYNYIEKMRSQL